MLAARSHSTRASGSRRHRHAANRFSPRWAPRMMAAAIMVSTIGTRERLTLAGARDLLRHGARRIILRQAGGTLNSARVPAWALLIQGLWAVLLVLPRTYNPATQTYGNLYSNLLDYIISAALIFYILTIAGVFRLRIKKAQCRSAVSRFRLPLAPRALHRWRGGHTDRAVHLSPCHHMAGPDHRDPRRAGLFSDSALRTRP